MEIHPVIESSPNSAADESLARMKLARLRNRSYSLQDELNRENQILEETFNEYQAVKQDIVQYGGVAHALKFKRNNAELSWRTCLSEYNKSQKRLVSTKAALSDLETSLKIETGLHQLYTERIEALRKSRPKLESELMSLSAECDGLASGIKLAVAERERLNDLLAKLAASSRESLKLLPNQSIATQTEQQFVSLAEVDSVRKDLARHVRMVKAVRGVVELVSRCS
jgi:chromosome segregation ATPase